MSALLERSPPKGTTNYPSKRSNESMRLGSVMKQAQKISLDLRDGKISRQEADRRLDELRRSK